MTAWYSDYCLADFCLGLPNFAPSGPQRLKLQHLLYQLFAFIPVRVCAGYLPCCAPACHHVLVRLMCLCNVIAFTQLKFCVHSVPVRGYAIRNVSALLLWCLLLHTGLND